MTALLLQTLLLMVPAFFIGAALACGLRKMLRPAEEASLAPAPARAPATKVEPLPQYAERATPAPATPIVNAPPAAVVPAKPAAAAAPQAPANRFDETLSARPAAAPVSAVQPTPVAAARAADAKPAEVSKSPAPPPPPAPTAARPDQVAPPAGKPAAPVTATAEMVASAAAAMAAAAAAVAAQARAATAPVSVAAPAPKAAAPASAPVAKPVAPTAPVAPAAALPVAPAVVVTPAIAPTVAPVIRSVVEPPAREMMLQSKPTADDLTRISVIDTAVNAQLDKLGVTRFSQIAAWRKSDVDTVSRSLGFQGRIEQENWIEQAQILAGGGETFYSARRSAATTAPGVSAPASRPAVVSTGAAVAAVTPSPQVQPATPQPAALQSAAASSSVATPPNVELRAAFADRASAPAAFSAPPSTLPLPLDRAVVHPSPVSAPVSAPISASVKAVPAAVAATVTPTPPVKAPAQTAMPSAVGAAAAAAMAAATAVAAKSAPPPVAATPAPVAPPVPASTAGGLPTPATSVRPAMAPSRDALQRIGAINGEIEKMLGAHGVTRFTQIAGWSPVEIERFDRLLGSQGRITRENWVEQAQILAKGGDTAHSRDYDRRLSESQRDASVRPKSITEAIKANAGAAAAAAAASVAPAAPLAGRPDIAGLRSVRSEAYRPSPSEIATAAAAAAGAGSARVVRSAEIDDLKRIRGIGVLIEKRLNSVGIVSYGQIADWTTDDIDRVSASLDFKGRIERENWVEQARILSAGGQTEFSRRVDRGEVETSKSR